MTRRELQRDLDQFILAGSEVIRARDPALAAVLDTMPPKAPTRRIPQPDRPLVASGPLVRVKRFLLRFRALHPLLDTTRAAIIRLRKLR